ncbi:hypothetical protein ACFRAO_31755 [Streptomyces sp. NPDC056656]|uniref:hypothetical protein n=1 Tax=Streptomyces sp. NPDC056656 TaxID=3345895 RepID=UPI0036861389
MTQLPKLMPTGIKGGRLHISVPVQIASQPRMSIVGLPLPASSYDSVTLIFPQVTWQSYLRSFMVDA